MRESERKSVTGTCLGESRVRVRVIGSGNPYAGEDSLGPEIVRRLRARSESACELLAMPQGGIELLESLRGADVVLVVDAVSSGAALGTLHLLPIPSPELEARAVGSVSTHGWGLKEVLGLMSALGQPTPRIMLLGIEVGNLVPGAPCSEPVEGAVRTVVDRFPQLLAFVAGAAAREECFPRRFLPGDESFPGGS